jgi:hypothetical protein
MRAIGALIFLGALACGPDLSRQAGGLEIRWLGVDGAADTLRGTVTQGAESYRVEAPRSVAVNRLSVETVPAGPVSVLGETLGLGQVIQTKLGATEIPVDGLGIVVLDLGSGGDGSANGRVTAHATAIKDQGDGTFRVDAAFDENLASFLDSAELTLGHPITELTVTGLKVTILTANEPLEDGLQELWAGTLRVSIGAASSTIDVATGALSESSTATLLPTSTPINAGNGLSAVLGRTAIVRLEGDADSSGGHLEADLSIDVDFRAE